MLPALGSSAIKCDFVLAAQVVGGGGHENFVGNAMEIRDMYLKNLSLKGLEVKKPTTSSDGTMYFWCVTASMDTLYDLAEELNEQLPTRKNDVYQWKRVSTDRSWWNRFKTWLNKVDPFKLECAYFDFDNDDHYFSTRFDRKRLSSFRYGKDPDTFRLFPQSLRSKLVFHILEHTKYMEPEHIAVDRRAETPIAAATFTPTSNLSNHIGISHLKTDGVFAAAYPCHDEPICISSQNSSDDYVPANDRQLLSLEWASFKCVFRYQPIELIRKYFGIRIAFYFKWLGFYTACLIPACVVGVMCMLYGLFSMIDDEFLEEICNPSKDEKIIMCPQCDKFCPYYSMNKFTCLYARVTHIFDNNVTPFFAVFMSFWSIIYLEMWKRREAKLIYDWHIMGYVDHEVVRPAYAVTARKTIRNPITGKPEPMLSDTVHALKLAGTFSVVFFFILLVVASVVGVMLYRAVMFSVGFLHTSSQALGSSDYSKLFITVTGATLNLIFINVLKFVYHRLAVLMTQWENPRTQSNFEKSFTLKLFWFQFCNTYSSLFYVAFFKSEFFTGWPGKYVRSNGFRLEGCSSEGCFLELCIQIVIIMVGQQFLGNFVEIGWPYLRRKYKAWKSKLHTTLPVPVWEMDYQLKDRSQLELVWEYQEVVLQYGFVTLFVAAFPLAPLFALITNIIEIRIDAINMVNAFRRPVASTSQGIGIWYEILATVTALSVLVNGFVLSFASEFIPRLVYKHQISVDGSMKGYVSWSLAHFNVSDFTHMERPDNIAGYENITHCRFSGHHESTHPYGFNTIHYKILSLRLLFAFVFQWTVTAATRVVAWVIPDRPKEIELSIKRENYLNREAMRYYRLNVQSEDSNIGKEGSAEHVVSTDAATEEEDFIRRESSFRFR